jgi:FAD/FMN-containing dehydrogenase
MQHSQATTNDVALDEIAVQAFKTGLRGELLNSTDASFDAARRVWNGMIDKTPALIVRCAGVADVIATVNFARAHDLLVAVRGGGHNVAGKAVCDGGIVIDLSQMKSIHVDPARRTARAEPGLTWGEFDRETQAFGLATTGGAVSTTGIAGLTLGGGVGWLMGQYGMTCDNLLSVDIVTADGQFLTASPTEHPDLFWALRGGGGNFGVVTSFEYQLHPVGSVLAGMLLHPLASAREVLRFYREFTAAAPDELTAYAGLLTAPDGTPMVAIILCYCGSLAEGERLVEPLRRFGPPAADLLRPMAYVELQSMLDAAFPPGLQSYWKANQMGELSDAAIDAIVAHAATVSSPMSAILIEHHHGAMSRVTPNTTAFAHRRAPYDFIIFSVWPDRAENDRHIRWTREFWQAMRPFFADGVYMNALSDDEGVDRIRAAYGTSYERLVAVKNQYDPANFFRVNQNIAPSGD